MATLRVTRPEAREVLSVFLRADFALPWLSHQPATMGDIQCTAARVSFAGELGWEIHAANADIPALYDAVIKAGATPFGMYALNSLRLEKGYRAWKGDLSTDYTMIQAGLSRFVKRDKPQDFPGKEALAKEPQAGPSKSFVTLTVDAAACDAPYMASILNDGDIVGEVTAGGWGYRVNKSIALGMIRADLNVPGTPVEIEIFGERRPAIVQADQPLWDPHNERLRA